MSIAYDDLTAALDAACRKANETGRAQAATGGYAGIGYRIYNADWATRYSKRTLEICRPRQEYVA